MQKGAVMLTDEKSLAIRNSARRAASLVVMSVHFFLALLAWVGRLGFTVDPTWQWLELAASDPLIWIPVNLACGLFIAVGISMDRRGMIKHSLSVSAGVILSWAFFATLWGLNSVSDVSLAGPVLGAGVGAGAWALSRAYVVPRSTHELRR